MRDIERFEWYPKFTKYIGTQRNIDEFTSVIEAWSLMPEAMRAYIMSIPEYDAKVFNGIVAEIEFEKNYITE